VTAVCERTLEFPPQDLRTLEPQDGKANTDVQAILGQRGGSVGSKLLQDDVGHSNRASLAQSSNRIHDPDTLALGG